MCDGEKVFAPWPVTLFLVHQSIFIPIFRFDWFLDDLGTSGSTEDRTHAFILFFTFGRPVFRHKHSVQVSFLSYKCGQKTKTHFLNGV